jgi:hypothetical protein
MFMFVLWICSRFSEIKESMHLSSTYLFTLIKDLLRRINDIQ